jgi:general stress protein 26
MPDQVDEQQKLWDLIEKIGFCMLTTHDGLDLKARPMSAYVERLENAIYFLTDVASHKDEEIARYPHVNLAFADPGHQKYVSILAQLSSRTTARRSASSGQRPPRPGGTMRMIRPSAFSR